MEGCLWNTTLGRDGRVYVGTYTGGRLGSRTIAAPGNGSLFCGSGNEVIASDLATGQVQRLATLPRAVENIAIDNRGAIFASGGPEVYRLTTMAEVALDHSKPSVP